MILNFSDNVFNYKIVMVGTGATGSQLLPFLCQLLNNYCNTKNHKLVIIDGDRFENKNLKNQKCSINDISRNKAEVLAERYKLVYKDINISFVDQFALNEHLIINLLNESNYIPILIGCVDNNASRKLLNKVFCSNLLKRLIYIDSGNGTLSRTGQVVVGFKTHTREKSGINNYGYDYFDTNEFQYKILKPVCDIFPEILKDNDSLDSLTSCSQVTNEFPQNIATNIMAASVIFSLINEILSFNKINSHIVYFDAEAPKIESVSPKYENLEEAFLNKNNRIYPVNNI